jgi:peptidoglycan/LPS O-acetylase OafA/YrhL
MTILQYPTIATIEQKKQHWLDSVKGVAIMGIFLHHATEPLFGSMKLGYPSPDWGPLGDRLSQLQPIDRGVWSGLVNLLRYAGWLGDVGVALFLITSSFGLTWSLLARSRHQGAKGRHEVIDWWDFLGRRLSRIYPLWWLTHGGFIVLWCFMGWGLSPFQWQTWASFLGLRITPQLFFYFAPAWWFVGMIVQLYLLYPLLWRQMERLGSVRFLLGCCALGWGIKAIGVYFLLDKTSLWHPGVLGLVRLPEFGLGIVLAVGLWRSPRPWHQELSKSRTMLGGLGLMALAIFLGLFLAGTVVFPMVLGTGALLSFYGLSERLGHRSNAVLGWLGEHSYSLFLLHHPIVDKLLPRSGWNHHWLGNTSLAFLALGLSLVAALGLEQVESWLRSRLSRKILVSPLK